MNLDGLPRPTNRRMSLPRTRRCSVVSGLTQTGPCSETNGAGIATANLPHLELPSPRVHVVVVLVVVGVVVVVVVVGRESQVVR